MAQLPFQFRFLRMSLIAAFVVAVFAAAPSFAQAVPNASGRLRVYFIDVEGGQATLFVTPTGQSLLMDTGWSAENSRDAKRIVAAAKDAGLSRIDYVLITHFHRDHAGGIPQLAASFPIGTFIDHGPNREFDKGDTERSFAAYQQLLASGKYKHIVAQPGEVLPITGIHATVISADGNEIKTPLPGGGQSNPFCRTSAIRPDDHTENSRSLGLQFTLGKLKVLDLGDLTWDKERPLMCPINKLGTVDVFVVSHHGMDLSSSPALVDALHARVSIMENGEIKGGSIPALDTVSKAPGLETLWQLHYAAQSGAHNTAASYIANPSGTDAGYSLKLIGNPDGSFDVVNERTHLTKHYAAR